MNGNEISLYCYLIELKLLIDKIQRFTVKFKEHIFLKDYDNRRQKTEDLRCFLSIRVKEFLFYTIFKSSQKLNINMTKFHHTKIDNLLNKFFLFKFE